MADLRLSEDDLARLAMALVPLLVPAMRNHLGEIGSALIERVGIEALLEGDFDNDVFLATVSEAIRDAEERGFSDLQPVEIGSLKGKP